MSLPNLVCPCCGKPVRGLVSADLLELALDLSRVQAAILGAVMAGRGNPVPTEAILRAIYGDRDDPPDPDRMYATFKERLCLLRPKLARVGLAVENVGRREGYRLVRLADVRAA